jgi:hypothetical protein
LVDKLLRPLANSTINVEYSDTDTASEGRRAEVEGASSCRMMMRLR